MKIPATLKHKPVVVSDNYEQVDGPFARNTDAKVLSLGLAQHNDRGKVELSAKVWRHTGGKGAQNSEELPLHRVLDLSILICRSVAHFHEAYRYEHLYDPQQPVIDRIGLQGDAMTVAINTENKQINEDIKLFSQALSDNDEMISERLRNLSKILKDMGY
ncbi:DUF6530 family protein [Paenibacillus alvei]|uniref:DUF6530 family protein n=1 Tax=Paenibacillus alvei TaxID=44250 RepID=A0ABT4GYR6_PAEAL|nr:MULTISPECIES: DUF6530 family protein [Paenibacillus]EJW15997.1 hypothetical protein PAV_6c00750 [Paenibacillus alvei DSM 29]MCY7482825.1 DUF6530 family protein [Paenibacillus alvei]MCY9539421.1 DUF6530 family protein [Paenibacillus alvei]MCY9704648.1 DUF6530 family protein [Paenibacillus alvei]MCY9732692.1 DUF6530 family protein [Paenibacillus alvei]